MTNTLPTKGVTQHSLHSLANIRLGHKNNMDKLSGILGYITRAVIVQTHRAYNLIFTAVFNLPYHTELEAL